MSVYRTACPLNCMDSCVFLVEVQAGKIVDIKGDPEHLPTRAFVCQKAERQLERMYSPDRLLYPMRKQGSGWERLSWEQALEVIAEKLTGIKARFGTTAVAHFHDSGSNGLLKQLDRRFFNAYGGVTVPEGCLCWGTGVAAQTYDFGACQAHSWEDLKKSRLIILWGRDPATTNLHLIPYLQAARSSGARVIVINPRKVKSAAFADYHLAPRTGTDGILALSMAYTILEERFLDWEFVANHAAGFEPYARMVKNYPPEKAADITGIDAGTIRETARLYAGHKPAAIVMGYGFQRYANGGQTVRAIDALAALTGNLGRAGGGASYAFIQSKKDLLTSLTGEELARTVRKFPVSGWGEALLTAEDPQIQALFITRSNPAAQLPNLTLVHQAFKKIPFVVTVDFFLNDTARLADLVLPCTTVFESEDVIANSMNTHLVYAPKLVEALGEALPDPEIFTRLAKLLGLPAFDYDTSGWLRLALAKGKAKGLTLESLKEKPAVNPLAVDVPWQELVFDTPSGKFELFSAKAGRDGFNPLPDYEEPRESQNLKSELSSSYPLRLLTVHPQNFIHSQFKRQDLEEPLYPEILMHPETARQRYLQDRDQVFVETLRGQIKASVKLDPGLRTDTVVIEEGGWSLETPGVNFLTPDTPVTMGLGTPYYDCLCQVRKIFIV